MKESPSILLLPAIALVSIVIGAPASSGAQEASLETQYEAAIQERDAGKYDTACPKLKEIVRIRTLSTGDPGKGLGARLELAACYEGAGKLASAFNEYKLVQTLASAAGKKEREAAAQRKLSEIREKVSTVTIIVPPDIAGLPGVLIHLDERPMARETWGVPMPIDAGAHSIQVTAANRQRWNDSFEIPPTRKEVKIEIKPSALPTTRIESGATTHIQSNTGQTPPADQPPVQKWLLPAGVGVTVLGAVGLGLGTGLAFNAAEKLEASRAECSGGIGGEPYQCSQEGLDLWSSARTSAAMADVAMIAGGALAAGGLVMVVIGLVRSTARSPAGARIVPMPGGLLTTLEVAW